MNAVKDLKSLVKWKKRQNRPEINPNYKYIQDLSPNVKPQHIVDAILADLQSGEFATYRELMDKHHVATQTIKRYAEMHGVEFVKRGKK